MKKALLVLVMVLTLMTLVTTPATPAQAGTGFDQYGYNNTARIFNGTSLSWALARGWTQAQAEAYFGPYLYDKLVMKWNAEWDRGNDENWSKPPYNAWTDNEYNGKFKGGSGSVWHYKIVWIGDYTADPSLIPDGAYGLWDEFAALMDHGVDPSYGPGHMFFAKAGPAGYGAYYSH
ncbi:MAG: hypothetical protein Q7R57_04585 [Dehalococcoidales bacterium]|nr:hypothetical protein [Dehalococcoidales bacterium]